MMEEKQDEFLDLINEYSEPKLFRVGQIISATAVAIDRDNNQVVFDFGGKGETWVEASEFYDSSDNITVEKDQKVDLMVVNTHPLKLSYKEAMKKQGWEKIRKAYETREIVRGTIINKNKGGFTVKLFDSQEVFMPNSHSFMKRHTLNKNIMGTEIAGIIIELRQHSAIFSHRQYMIDIQEKIFRAIHLALEKGKDIFKGTIMSLHDFGAFVDIGGIEGLVPKTEISYKRFFSIKDELKINQKVNVKLIKFEEEKKKIILSIKQVQPDPWESFITNYKLNDIVEGTVVSLEDFGAFVEIIPGVDGLVHVSEISWTEKIHHPKTILKLKDRIKVKILEINDNSKRIALGLKQLETNPWEEFKNNHPEGETINGTVSKITSNGAEITLENNLQGFIFNNDITWDQEPSSVGDYLEEGKSYPFFIIKVDKDRQRILLGRKQLTRDVFQEFINKYRVNQDVTGKVISVNPFGLKVELEEGIIGIVPDKEISSYDTYDSEQTKKNIEGDSITARIVKTDPRERKIVLSIRRYEKSIERREIKEYSDKGGATFNLGDLLQNDEGK